MTALPPPWLILAPLRGFTDVIFRTVFGHHFGGIDEAVAPFVTSLKGRRIKPSHLRDLTPEHNRAMPVVPQILSNDSDEFICLATALFDMGYREINWNLGCPYPMVARKMRGSGLLPHPETVDRLLAQIIGAIPGRLSVKTRLGRYSPAEIIPLIPIFNRYPLARVIVHPRVGEQMYEGHVDLDAFKACLADIVHPVVYNGDIVAPDGFLRLKAMFPDVAGWMLGRGLVANPFLAEMIKNEVSSGKCRSSRFQAFHDDLVDGYIHRFSGPAHVLDRMKGFWRYFADGFAADRQILKRIRKAGSLKQYRMIVAGFLARHDPD